MTVSADAVETQSNPIHWRDRLKLPLPDAEQLFGANFAAMLMDLRRARWTKVAIAKTLKLARGSVQAYSGGDTEPLHPAGEKIIVFWCQQMGKSRDDVPMRRIYRWSHHAEGSKRDRVSASRSFTAAGL